MGRKSKLTDEQWQEVERRLLDGEATRSIARDVEVSEAAIRARKSAHVAQVKSVANQVVAAEQAMRALPISAQVSAQNYAAKLRSLMDHTIDAATYGAATSHRLAAIANAELQKVDDANPFASMDSLRAIGALTELANKSGAMGLAVLGAAKKQVERVTEHEPEPEVSIDGYLEARKRVINEF